MHAAKLIGWHGEEDHEDVQQLLKVVEGFCGDPSERKSDVPETPHLATPIHTPPQKNEHTGKIPKLTLPDKPSIAVLPFDNMSADPEQEYFSDGITEDLITDLSKISGLFVISRHSSFVYKGKSVTAREVSNGLGVRYIVEGSVRRAGKRLRINAQLIDALTEDHLWAERFDRQLDDIFEVQDEVSKKIVNALEIKLTSKEKNQLVQQSTNIIDAHDALVRGRDLYYQYTPDSIAKARGILIQAIKLDANYIDAYVLLARITIFEHIAGWIPFSKESLDPAFELANKAASLNDKHAKAHAVLGWAYIWKKQSSEAIIEIEKALELDPNDSETIVWLSFAYSSIGKGQKALDLAEQALRLNPYYPAYFLHGVGCAYLTMEDYEQCLSAGERCFDNNPNFLPAYVTVVASCMELGREEEAKKWSADLRRISPDYVLGVSNLWMPETSQYQLVNSHLEKLGFSYPK
jgi:adenylate cyclase